MDCQKENVKQLDNLINPYFSKEIYIVHIVDNIYLFETYLDVFLHVEQSWANLHWSACLWAITDNSSSQTWNNNFILKCESSQTEQKLSALEINMTLHKNCIGPFQLLDMSEHHLKNVCRKSLAGSIHLSSQKKKGPAISSKSIYLFKSNSGNTILVI